MGLQLRGYKMSRNELNGASYNIFGMEDYTVRTRSATERWGGNGGLFKEGFLSGPNRFLRRYASLNPPLTSGEALFVLQLMTFNWDHAAPFPTYTRLARLMGVTDKMARRNAQCLQKKGYLIRHFQKRAANKFDLTGLFEALARNNSK
jgi:Helix-turn-helix domain